MKNKKESKKVLTIVQIVILVLLLGVGCLYFLSSKGISNFLFKAATNQVLDREMVFNRIESTETSITVSSYNARLGDVNYDGEITLEDVSLINKHINNEITFDPSSFKIADVNGDGTINNADINLLYRVINDEYSVLQYCLNTSKTKKGCKWQSSGEFSNLASGTYYMYAKNPKNNLSSAAQVIVIP